MSREPGDPPNWFFWLCGLVALSGALLVLAFMVAVLRLVWGLA